MLATAVFAALAGQNAMAAVPANLHCRHFLATVGSAGDLPYPIVQLIKSWMVLRGEAWNHTDARRLGELSAGFSWAAQWSGNWIVAYDVGGIACCHTRFALFAPVGDVREGRYREVTPSSGKTDPFDHADCAGIDAALDAYAKPL